MEEESSGNQASVSATPEASGSKYASLPPRVPFSASPDITLPSQATATATTFLGKPVPSAWRKLLKAWENPELKTVKARLKKARVSWYAYQKYLDHNPAFWEWLYAMLAGCTEKLRLDILSIWMSVIQAAKGEIPISKERLEAAKMVFQRFDAKYQDSMRVTQIENPEEQAQVDAVMARIMANQRPVIDATPPSSSEPSSEGQP